MYQAAHEQAVRVKTFFRTKGKAFWRKRWDAARRLSRRWRQSNE
jgi:hypothetical protein